MPVCRLVTDGMPAMTSVCRTDCVGRVVGVSSEVEQTRTGTPASHRLMISVEYRVSVMNQNETSIPAVLGLDQLMIVVRQYWKAGVAEALLAARRTSPSLCTASAMRMLRSQSAANGVRASSSFDSHAHRLFVLISSISQHSSASTLLARRFHCQHSATEVAVTQPRSSKGLRTEGQLRRSSMSTYE